MAFYEKLRILRKEMGLSQEELADRIGVSRQAMSKWESGQSYPELDKLIVLSGILNVSIDELVKDQAPDFLPIIKTPYIGGYRQYYEYKSERTLFGLPLIHVNIGRGFDFRKAKGIIAIGNRATGVISIGLLARGFLSFGLLSFGAVSVGVLSLGLIAAGSIAVGGLALGAIAIGIVAMGAVAVGMFSVGALALASHIAVGDHAHGHIAIGRVVQGAKTIIDTSANNDFSSVSAKQVRELIAQEYPGLWAPIVSFVTGFFR